jgi:hypothetical protein
MYVAHDADPEEARRQIGLVNERLLSGLGVSEDRRTTDPTTTTTTTPNT